MVMLRDLLNALGAKRPTEESAPGPVVMPLVREVPRPIRKNRPKSGVTRYPRSVCTTLKDLCEL
jgi:hypothetical protein